MQILGCIGLLALIPLSFVVRGYCLAVLWGWFMVPTFGVKPLSIAYAIGISIVIGMLTGSRDGREGKVVCSSDVYFFSTFAGACYGLDREILGINEMSYDIRMVDPITREPKQLSKSHNRHGGTYALGGTTEAWLNVTYNYHKFFLDTLDAEKGIRVLYGMTGREAYPILEAAVKALGLETDVDYWKATPEATRAERWTTCEFWPCCYRMQCSMEIK